MSHRRRNERSARARPSGRVSSSLNADSAKAFREDLCGQGVGIDIGTIDAQRIEGIRYGQDSKEDLNEALKRSRYFARRNMFVDRVLFLRQSIFNFGFHLAPAEKGKEKRVELEQWWNDPKNRRSRSKIERYVRDCWAEWLVSRNLITLWRTDSKAPVVLAPEAIGFKDEFGEEVLTIVHTLTAAQIDAMDISAQAKARLKKDKKLKITHNDDLFSFEVLKLEKSGSGLGWPDMLPILLECGQWESMSVGDNILAQAGRSVIEQHALGHETRYGPQAGMPVNFITEKRSKGTLKERKGATGHQILTTNWDHKISWPRPDVKEFDGKKYQGVVERLLWWALPFGHMVVARAFNPNLMDLLRGIALEERSQMRSHIEVVINEVFGGENAESKLPMPVRVKWNETILKDSRLLAEMVKNGLNVGANSQRTYNEVACVDPEREWENKTEEAGMDSKITKPLYDGAHGPPKAGGKPSGTKDQS